MNNPGSYNIDEIIDLLRRNIRAIEEDSKYKESTKCTLDVMKYLLEDEDRIIGMYSVMTSIFRERPEDLEAMIFLLFMQRR